MANTYESKFKGVEVDEGVNIARNLTGTGGIEVKKTATGTINATVTIDGSGVKITPVSGTGTSTTTVMSQKAVTDELGKKQDTITNKTLLDVGAIRFGGLTESFIDYDMIGSRGAFRLPDYQSGPHILATRDDLPDIVQATGTATGSVMSQRAVTDELGKKQDELTVSSYIHINSLMADHAITLGNYSENVILLPQSGASGLVYFPKDGGYLATTGDIPAIVPITGTGTTTVMSQKAVTDELGKKQDKLTVSSNVHINSLTVAATSAADGLYFTNETGAGISYRILNAAGSGTAPLTRLTVPNDIAGKTQTIATREYVNAHSSSYNPGSGIDISGNTISLAKRIMVDNITLGNYSSGNVILLPQSGASGNVYFPKYGGTLATTNDIPAPGITGVSIINSDADSIGTVSKLFFGSAYQDPVITPGNWLGVPVPKTKTINGQSILGLGDITIGGGSAGVSSIGGKTGAITLSTGLAMSGQQLVNKVKVYTSGNYLCIDTN